MRKMKKYRSKSVSVCRTKKTQGEIQTITRSAVHQHLRKKKQEKNKKKQPNHGDVIKNKKKHHITKQSPRVGGTKHTINNGPKFKGKQNSYKTHSRPKLEGQLNQDRSPKTTSLFKSPKTPQGLWHRGIRNSPTTGTAPQ